jgi:hypothetical protein
MILASVGSLFGLYNNTNLLFCVEFLIFLALFPVAVAHVDRLELALAGFIGRGI